MILYTPMEQTKRSFTQKEATDITEISPNTLQGWTRDGLIIPSIANPRGRGKMRLYSASDLVLIKIVSILSGYSYNRDVIKEICDYVNKKTAISKIAAKKSDIKETHLNPLIERLEDAPPILLKLSDNKWDEIGTEPFATAMPGKSTTVLIINVSKIVNEIRSKIK